MTTEAWRLAEREREPSIEAGVGLLKAEILRRRKANDPLRPAWGWLGDLEVYAGYMVTKDWEELEECHK